MTVSPTQPLDWSHRVTEVAEQGLRVERSADEAELAAVAAALELPGCERLEAKYAVKAIGEGRYRMTGEVRARLTQACVVTLEPVPARVEESFEVEFWPGQSIPEQPEGEVEVLSLPEIEPIEHGKIAAGRVIFETLSAGLDPFPRKAGAELADEDLPAEPDAAAAGPFAALKKLRNED